MTELYFRKLLYVFILSIFSKSVLLAFAKYVGYEELSLKGRGILSEWIENISRKNEENNSDSYVEMMLDADIDKSVAMSDMTSILMVGTFTTAESIELGLITLAKYPLI